MLDTFRRWMALADGAARRPRGALLRDARQRRPAGVDLAIEEAPGVEACDERVVDLGGGYTMISLGYSNLTPFDSPRELDEEELYRRVEAHGRAGRGHARTASSTSTCRRTRRASTWRRSSTRTCRWCRRGPAEDGAVRLHARSARRSSATSRWSACTATSTSRAARPGSGARWHQPRERLPHGPHLRLPRPPRGRPGQLPVRGGLRR